MNGDERTRTDEVESDFVDTAIARALGGVRVVHDTSGGSYYFPTQSTNLERFARLTSWLGSWTVSTAPASSTTRRYVHEIHHELLDLHCSTSGPPPPSGVTP